VPRTSNRNPVPFGGAAFKVDRCDRAALENAAEEHLIGEGHRDRLSCLNDRNSLALSRHDARQILELPKAEAQRSIERPPGLVMRVLPFERSAI
jgi:hypothetical protein